MEIALTSWEVGNQLVSTSLNELLFQVQYNEPTFHPHWQYSSKTFHHGWIAPNVLLLWPPWMSFGLLSAVSALTSQRALDVNITSPQRRCNVASTLRRRCIYVMCLPGFRIPKIWCAKALLMLNITTVGVTASKDLPYLGLSLTLDLPSLNCAP